MEVLDILENLGTESGRPMYVCLVTLSSLRKEVVITDCGELKN